MDHDTCLTCLWEVEELQQLAVITLAHQDEQPPAERNFLWQCSPEGTHSSAPGAALFPTTCNLGEEWLQLCRSRLKWGAGVYEQNALPLLKAISTSTCQVEGSCQAHDIRVMSHYLAAGTYTTLPYALWGMEGKRNRDGIKHRQLVPGLKVDHSKLGQASRLQLDPKWSACRPVHTASLTAFFRKLTPASPTGSGRGKATAVPRENESDPMEVDLHSSP